MPRNRVKSSIGGRCNYEPEQLFKAIQAVKSGLTQTIAAQQFGVPRGTIASKISGHASMTSIGAGRKPELSEEDEEALVTYLKTTSQCGEGLSREEIKDLVQEYVKSRNLKTRFKDSRPGSDWLAGFLKRRSDLSWRKGERLSKKRFKGSDPFIVYQFYEDIEELYKSNDYTEQDGCLIFNCDETSFCHDPSEFKVLSAKGTKRISLNIAGSGKKNTTVLACCSASGLKLPPFIIFKGKNVQSTWHNEDAFPGTVITASERGWMEGSLFAAWFNRVFIKHIPTVDARKGKMVTLFFDGCKSHITLSLIHEAKANNVHLVKLPANLTHYLQPLDKTCFSAIKTAWNRELLCWQRQHHTAETVPNKEFIKLIGKIWNEAFTTENMISGFTSTGLFPINKERFPKNEFDNDALMRYNSQKKKQNQSVEQETEEPSSVLNEKTTGPTTLTVHVPSSSATTGIQRHVSLILGKNTATSNNDNQQPSTSKMTSNCDMPAMSNHFETFIRSRISKQVRGHQETLSAMKPKPKRKKISKYYGEILTMGNIEERMKEMEQEPSKKTKKSCSKSKSTRAKKTTRRPHTVSSSSSDSDNVPITMCDDDSDDFEIQNDRSDDEPTEKSELNVLLESYYAIFFDSKWYLGRVIAINENICTVKFLDEGLNYSFTWPKKNVIEEIDKKFIFYGPVKLEGNGPFMLLEAAKIRSAYRLFKKM